MLVVWLGIICIGSLLLIFFLLLVFFIRFVKQFKLKYGELTHMISFDPGEK